MCGDLIGCFVTSCEHDGSFSSQQCHPSTGMEPIVNRPLPDTGRLVVTILKVTSRAQVSIFHLEGIRWAVASVACRSVARSKRP